MQDEEDPPPPPWWLALSWHTPLAGDTVWQFSQSNLNNKKYSCVWDTCKILWFTKAFRKPAKSSVTNEHNCFYFQRSDFCDINLILIHSMVWSRPSNMSWVFPLTASHLIQVISISSLWCWSQEWWLKCMSKLSLLAVLLWKDDPPVLPVKPWNCVKYPPLWKIMKNET